MTKAKLEINLNEIKNPHKLMLQAYKEAGAENLYFSHIPANINEQRCFAAAAASSKPLKHSITHLYRVQTKDQKEYCYFGEELYAQDYWNNTIQHFRTVGKYEKPVFQKVMGLNPSMLKDNTDINAAMAAQAKEISIDHMEIVYEYPWEEIKPILEKYKEEGIVTDETQLLVIIGQQKYSKPFSWYEWLNLDIQDAALIARVGRSSQIRDKDLTPEVLQKLRTRLNEQAIEQIGKTK